MRVADVERHLVGSVQRHPILGQGVRLDDLADHAAELAQGALAACLLLQQLEPAAPALLSRSLRASAGRPSETAAITSTSLSAHRLLAYREVFSRR